MSILCVIPARGGSKRLPGKNMRVLGNMPLVGWSIMHAIICGQFIDQTIVSSDSDEILKYAGTFFGITPLRRPAELATDTADSYCVLRHAYHAAERPHEHILLLQPTSPLRIPIDVAHCLGIAETTPFPAVVSYEIGRPVPNGAVYVGRSDWLLDGGSFDHAACHHRYDMPAQRSIDVNTLDDFEHAEEIISGMQK